MGVRPTMLLSGMIAATPGHGGATWAVLQYLLGFRELGWDVWFVEPAPVAHGAWCDDVMTPLELHDRWCLLDGDATAGASRNEIFAAASRADLLVNVSGMLTEPAILDAIPVRVYLDLDPAFVQMWHAYDGVDMRLDAHTHFVTLSDRVGAVGGVIPDCGRSWQPILPPVALSHWPVSREDVTPRLTTIANWRAYGSVWHDGVHYGQKAHAWRAFFDLPRRTSIPIEVALGIHPDEVDDLKALADHDWRLVDPDQTVRTPEQYQHFVQTSWAELGIAKSGYVLSDSGWFSDRSAAYLASGRPVLAQDTGFGRRLPTGDGLLPFTSADEAVAALDVIADDYEHHREAARALAEQHFDSARVLTSLLEVVLS